jgi:CO/xanthine dehydrogenase FAD-binding subunit
MSAKAEYHRPTTIGEAIAIKEEYGADARFWAGGTDLYLLLERKGLRIGHCIDLTGIDDLRGITADEETIQIGSMATLDDIDRASRRYPLLQAAGETARLMCTPQTRTLATVGGNMCHAAPSADLSPVLIALDAEAVIAGKDGERTLPLAAFFEGVNATALRGSELLRSLRIPLPKNGKAKAASYRRVARTVVDIALVSSCVSLELDSEAVVKQARVVLGAVAPIPVRAANAETVLRDRALGDLDEGLLAMAGEAAAEASSPITDIRASEWYRRRMCDVLTRRAIRDSARILGGVA